MRARAGDPPRTMAQKVLAARAPSQSLARDEVDVKVDQVVLARAPGDALKAARGRGLTRTTVEVAVAYEGCVIRAAGDPPSAAREGLAHGILLAREGAGFPGPVHLERFASPARLCITDDARLASLGGIGMLTLVVSAPALGQALAVGTVRLRPPRSVQVHLSGRVRPFVCARDVALELLRRGVLEAVGRASAKDGASVVVEVGGPSARTLSVAERAVIAGMAPQVGADAIVFVSDERTEVFLRDQRRSKAFRALAPDPGAPCEEVLNIDLSAVDPLLQDETGQVRAVRDLAGKAVSQVLLGGDGGVTLRDLMAAAMLLKAKRVPPGLEFLLAPPSRQAFEVLATTGLLADLLATGARTLEPDGRIASGELYPPNGQAMSLRTADRATGVAPPFVVASAETLAWAVATGEIGDPRAFKRPVRVTVPRALPTDDVLLVRERRAVSPPRRRLNAE